MDTRTRLSRFSLGVSSLALLTVLAACAPAQPAPASQPTKPAAQSTASDAAKPAQPKSSESAPAKNTQGESWNDVVAAAKKEGTVVLTRFASSRGIYDALEKRFEELYGVKVEEVSLRAGEFVARQQTELAAGKATMDVRSSGSSECRDLESKGLLMPFGSLPEADDPSAQWMVDPLTDVKLGKAGTLLVSANAYFLVVNNKVLPPDAGPRSYRDLADPKYKGLIVLDEPGAPSFGTLWAASVWNAYGEQHVRDVLSNVKAISTSSEDAVNQTVQGVYGIYIHALASALVGALQLPEPRPFRLVTPEDGVMASAGTLCSLKGAPHPSATRLFMNFFLSKDAQTVMASQAGGEFNRKDVTPKAPELVPFLDKNTKFFPENPNSYDFQITSKKYFTYGEKTGALLPEYHLK